MYLFLTDPMIRGSAVKRVQEMLSFCGYDVGEWGPDGIYGRDTVRAVLRYQQSTRRNLRANGVVDAATWNALEDDVQSRTLPEDVQSKKLGPGVILDITKEHNKPKLYRHHRSPRSWSKIEGVTLHQVGCNLSENPSRWYSLNAHIAVLKSGTILIVNDLTDFIWHAQGFSYNTIGIEFNGNFYGDENDITTWWVAGGESAILTSGQYQASKYLLKYLRAQFEKNGAKFSKIFAHRQSSKDRRADPGSEIWRMIAMPWMEETGATDGGPDYVYGTGRPIPKNWNKSYTHKY